MYVDTANKIGQILNDDIKFLQTNELMSKLLIVVTDKNEIVLVIQDYLRKKGILDIWKPDESNGFANVVNSFPKIRE